MDAGFKLSSRKRELYPDFDVMSGYYYMGELEDMWEVKAEVAIPIFSRSKQQKRNCAYWIGINRSTAGLQICGTNLIASA